MPSFTKSVNIFADTITLNTITAQAGSTFTVSGTLSGFTSAPSLSYADDNGTANPVTSGVTSTGFSFTHPALNAGSHNIAVFLTGDPNRSATQTFIVGASTAPGPPTGLGLYSATSSQLTISLTPPDTNQVYTYNCALGTTGTGGPFPTQVNGLSLIPILDPINSTVVDVIQVPGLTRHTNYYVSISAVAPGNLIGTPATGGPFSTLQVQITVNPITASAGSTFIVNGSIA